MKKKNDSVIVCLFLCSFSIENVHSVRNKVKITKINKFKLKKQNKIESVYVITRQRCNHKLKYIPNCFWKCKIGSARMCLCVWDWSIHSMVARKYNGKISNNIDILLCWNWLLLLLFSSIVFFFLFLLYHVKSLKLQFTVYWVM